jgi:hypothetical protein
MKIMIESTDKIVTIERNGAEMPARVWQGETEDGIPVQCYITRIAPEIPENHVNHAELTADFARELQECAPPRPSVQAIPLRLVI